MDPAFYVGWQQPPGDRPVPALLIVQGGQTSASHCMSFVQ